MNIKTIKKVSRKIIPVETMKHRIIEPKMKKLLEKQIKKEIRDNYQSAFK